MLSPLLFFLSNVISITFSPDKHTHFVCTLSSLVKYLTFWFLYKWQLFSQQCNGQKTQRALWTKVQPSHHSEVLTVLKTQKGGNDKLSNVKCWRAVVHNVYISFKNISIQNAYKVKTVSGIMYTVCILCVWCIPV